MLAVLNDNHVKLTGWGRWLSAAGSLRGAGAYDDFSATVVRERYLAGPPVDASEAVAYGWLPDSVGYVRISSVGDLEASLAALDRALETFAAARGVVLDLRGNFGGDDDVGQALAGRFADRPRHYMTTRLKRGPGPDDFTAPKPWHVAPPAGGGYTSPVVALTHGYTFSAAENLVLALRALPHVTVVGTRTSGSMGETTNDVLPNGWVYRLVFQRIVDAEGRGWEGVGIPPDLRVANAAEEVAAGRDRALETAEALIASGAATGGRTRPDTTPVSVPPRLPLADSLAAWIGASRLETALERYRVAAADSTRWFLAEDWEYGDLTTLGRDLLEGGRVEASVAVLELAVDAYPGSYRPHQALARAHTLAGASREAEAARRRALALNPGLYAADRRAAIEARGRVPLGHRFLDLVFDRGVEAAVADYRAQLAADPESVEVDPLLLVRAGQQFREGGQREASRDVFAFMVEAFPGHPLAHIGLGEAHRSLGDPEAALDAYRRALEIDPDLRPAREWLRHLSEPDPE